MEKLIYKKEIPKLVKDLTRKYTLYAPIDIKGNIEYKRVQNGKDIELEFLNSKVPPKEILFPRMETLFKYKINAKNIEIIKPDKMENKNIIFGIRPCDAHSFVLLEQFFDFGEFKDELFLNKRKITILIGIGCNTPRNTCFCTSLDGHPFKKDDMDVFMVDLDDRYLVSPISDIGKEIIENLSWLVDAKEEDLELAMKLSEEAESMISTTLDIQESYEFLDSKFSDPIWYEISETCMGCGTCSFLCPTCTCFDVIDEEDHYNKRGRRIRIWDTCQFCLYSLHTSGHNPRDSGIERCRNRILHKFSYYPANYKLIGCVGCGRCIQLCPVNNDLRVIIKRLNEIKMKEEKTIVA
jgi:ferredoxin